VIINDILEVIYAPARLFKRVFENPKYLGVLLILVFFLGAQVAFQYAQFSKTYTEQTAPTVDQFPMVINATLWQSSPNINISDNFNDFFNYSIHVASLGAPVNPMSYYNIFGNSSLEIGAINNNSLTATLEDYLVVDCGPDGFQNISMIIKIVEPQEIPQNVTLTLYTLSSTDFFQRDITHYFQDTSTNDLWNNLTLSVGPHAQNWASAGDANWSNVTALQLDFEFSADTNPTVRIGGLFFGGQYLTPIETGGMLFLLQFMQAYALQFVFTWFLLTGLIFLLFKVFKSTVVWKSLFVVVGFALFVLVIRAVLFVATTIVLPPINYPYDLSFGIRFDILGTLTYPAEAVGTLSTQSQAAYNSIVAMTQTFKTAMAIIFLAAYVWLGGLVTFIIGTAKPEFSIIKRVLISVVSIGVIILLLLLLVGFA
jgi:hypothetical protein